MSQAFFYSNGHMTPINGKLPGTLPNHQTRPLVINDLDQIIGFATKSGNAQVLNRRTIQGYRFAEGPGLSRRGHQRPRRDRRILVYNAFS